MEFAATNNGRKHGVRAWHTTQCDQGQILRAGNAPEKGINAVIEFAHQTLKITELNALDLGTSVSVTVVHRRHRSNVIPAERQARSMCASRPKRKRSAWIGR
ncbi:MAG: peptidase dimerization domain-containing protein [Anaerolineae bacterium]